MDEEKIFSLWKSNNENLANSYSLIRQNANDMSHMKVQSLLHAMKPIKKFALVTGIAWVLLGIGLLSRIYLNDFEGANKFFFVSALIQILITVIALVLYVYQLVLIHQIDITAPILKTQDNLNQVKITTLWIVRVLLLQLPVWTTFWWNNTMLKEWEIWQWFLAITITILFTLAALWLFFNIKYENRDKKWFQVIFSGKEWIPLMKAIDLMDQVENYTDSKK